MRSGVSRPVRSGLGAGAILGLLAAASPASAAESAVGLSQADKDAVLRLVLVMKSEDYKVSAGAEKRLLKAGKKVVPYLCELLETGPEDLPRARVVRVLEEIGDRRALRSVALMSTREHPSDVRMSAVYALSKIGGKGVDKYLVRLLRDKEIALAQTAFQGLSKLIRVRRSDPSGSRELADLLLGELSEAEGQARLWTVGLLGQVRDKRAVRPLLRIVRSGPPELKRPALEALVRTGDEKAAPGLFDLLRRGRLVEKLHKEAISAVGSLGKEDLVPDMISLMEEKPELARPLADALAKITGQRIGPNAHAWWMWWTKKHEGEEAVLEMIGIPRRPRAAADAGGPVATPGAPAAEGRPAATPGAPAVEGRPSAAAPPAEPEKRRSYARYVVWAVMAAVFVVAMAAVQLIHSRSQKAKVAGRRRRKSR